MSSCPGIRYLAMSRGNYLLDMISSLKEKESWINRYIYKGDIWLHDHVSCLISRFVPYFFHDTFSIFITFFFSSSVLLILSLIKFKFCAYNIFVIFIKHLFNFFLYKNSIGNYTSKSDISFHANPLARRPGQVKLNSDKNKLWNNLFE